MKIIGTGSALPEKVVTNEMLSGFLETSDDWIVSRTGIRSRRLLSKETLRDLAVSAARQVLESSGLFGDGATLLLSSFGGGFVTGAALLTWSQIHYQN